MLSIRRADIVDAHDIARVQVASWRKAYKGIVPDEHLDAMELAPRIERWGQKISDMTDDNYALVAELNADVIGFSSIGKPRDKNAGFDAEIWAIYLDPDYWRGGHGGALLKYSMQCLKTMGAKNMYVWVLKDNRIGCGFYKKMGAIEIKGLTKVFSTDDFSLDEVAYGWPSL